MTRTHRFLGGISYGYISLAVTTVAGLWLTPFILARLGQHDYGLWLVGAQIMAYLALLDLGVVALLPRETAYLTGRSHGADLAPALRTLIGRTAVIVLAQAPLVILASAGVIWFLPADWQALRWPLAFMLAAFVLAFPLRLFSAFLQGLQELPFLGKVQLVAWTASTLAIVGLLLSGARLYALAAGVAITLLVPAAVAWVRVRVRHRECLPASPRLDDRKAARTQIAQSTWVSAAQVAQVLLYGTDLMIVAKVFGPAAVVPYSCTGKLITVLANQPQVLTGAAGPALSELKAAGDREKLFRVSSTLGLATMILSGGVFCCILAVNRGFVGWWVGSAQYGGLSLTIFFLLNMLARHLNVTVSYALFCFGYERRTSTVALVDGALTIALALLLVGGLGPVGVVLASVLSVTLVALPLNVRALAREVDRSVATLTSTLGPWAWRFALVAIPVGFLLPNAVPAHFLPLAGAGGLVGCAYMALMLPLVLRGPLGAYTVPVLVTLGGRALGWLRWLPGGRRIRRPDPARLE